MSSTNNACATGSTGLHMARTLIRSGAADCVLVVGFEQMSPGSIKSAWTDRPSPMGLSTQMMGAFAVRCLSSRGGTC